MNIKNALIEAKKKLEKAEVAEPESSAEFLLRQVVGLNRAQFYAQLERKLTLLEIQKYKRYIKRRLKHEPVWQIVGRVEFWGLDFYVNKNVLVPRPETEFLVQEVLSTIKKRYSKINHRLQILDVGTGAGPIVCALASEIENADLFASDVSTKALSIAKKNAKKLVLEQKIKFKKGNLLEPFNNQKFDIITANLPYIPHEDLGGLALDIHHHEPRLALDGGSGGLVLYQEFLSLIPSHVNPSARIYCEIGKGQGGKFKILANRYLPNSKTTIIKDLAGFDRIAVISF